MTLYLHQDTGAKSTNHLRLSELRCHWIQSRGACSAYKSSGTCQCIVAGDEYRQPRREPGYRLD
jgi:hypothetical protein